MKTGFATCHHNTRAIAQRAGLDVQIRAGTHTLILARMLVVQCLAVGIDVEALQGLQQSALIVDFTAGERQFAPGGDTAGTIVELCALCLQVLPRKEYAALIVETPVARINHHLAAAQRAVAVVDASGRDLQPGGGEDLSLVTGLSVCRQFERTLGRTDPAPVLQRGRIDGERIVGADLSGVAQALLQRELHGALGGERPAVVQGRRLQ